jgi:uncharacterized repeat protein (TIGR01451 family)
MEKSTVKMIAALMLSVALSPALVMAQHLNDAGRVSASTFAGIDPQGAGVLAGSGSMTGTEPTMSPRFFRPGLAGEPCGTFSAGEFQYQEVPFFSDAGGSLTASFDPDTCSTGLYVTFHMAPFNPASICDGFVFSHGSSQLFTETFTVPASSEMVMIVSGVPNAPSVVCGPFTYSITGANLDADLSITLTDAPDPVAVGAELTYTATVANDGPVDATDVVVTLSLPVETSFVSGSVSGGGSCAGSPVLCTFDGILSTDSPRTATIVVAVDPSVVSGTTIEASASVGSASPDPDLTNNDASTTTSVLNEVFADGFEDPDAPLRIELDGNPPTSIDVPFLDAVASTAPRRVVNVAALLQNGERIGVVQVRCDATCHARVLHLPLDGARHADTWTRVERDPLRLRITVSSQRLIDVRYE